jgi:SAM-dependent methyltransferase
LNLELERKKYDALEHWFSTPQGQFIQEEISAKILMFSGRFRGTSVLQLGLCGESFWLNELLFRRQWRLTPCTHDPRASVISSLHSLPFERASLDCVIAPFSMELAGEDKRLIHEIDRILKPMGHVIFIGFNPFSLWGLFLKLGFIDGLRDLNLSLISSLTIKQWMQAEGYRLTGLRTFCYVPPVRSSRALTQLRFLNEMGKMVILSPAGFYCLVLQKYQYAKPRLVAQKKKSPLHISQTAVGLARVEL